MKNKEKKKAEAAGELRPGLESEGPAAADSSREPEVWADQEAADFFEDYEVWVKPATTTEWRLLRREATRAAGRRAFEEVLSSSASALEFGYGFRVRLLCAATGAEEENVLCVEGSRGR